MSAPVSTSAPEARRDGLGGFVRSTLGEAMAIVASWMLVGFGMAVSLSHVVPDLLGSGQGTWSGSRADYLAAASQLITLTIVAVLLLTAVVGWLRRSSSSARAVPPVVLLTCGNAWLYYWAGGQADVASLVLGALVVALIQLTVPRHLAAIAGGLGTRKVVAISVGSTLLAAYYFMAAVLLPPSTVNSTFTARSWPLLLALGLFTGGLGMMSTASRGDRRSSQRLAGPVWRDLVFAIPPLIPILQYVSANAQEVPAVGLAMTVLGAGGVVMLTVVLIPSLATPIADATIVRALASAGAFTLTNMASLAASNAWYEVGDIRVQLLVLLVTAIVLVGVSQFSMRLVTVAAVILLLLRSATSALSVWQLEPAEDMAAENRMEGSLQRAELGSAPDIYLLFYDAYPGLETLEAYGIDNSDQAEALEELGFRIYPGVYSNWPYTNGSLSSMFAGASEQAGTRVGGDDPTTRSLKRHGYRTAGLSWSAYLWPDSPPQFDVAYPDTTESMQMYLPASVAQGEFRGFVPSDQGSLDGLREAKDRALSGGLDSPAFLLSYVPTPGHAPADGPCRPDEMERYSDGLDEANAEMLRDIDTLSDAMEDAIVVIAGDHGPNLTKNCDRDMSDLDASEVTRLDIQDRFGTFLAVHWPRGMDRDYDIRVLQDVMPAIFATLADDDSIWMARDSRDGLLGGMVPDGIDVVDGTIVGGPDGGQPLFVGQR